MDDGLSEDAGGPALWRGVLPETVARALAARGIDTDGLPARVDGPVGPAPPPPDGAPPVPGAADGWWLHQGDDEGALLALGPLDGLRKAARMAATREMAGKLAHELNNALMALSGYAELLQLDPALQGRDEIAAIRRCAERIATMNLRLLRFSGRYSLDLVPRDAGALVVGAEGHIRSRLSVGATLALDVAGAPAGQVDVDEAALTLAVDELIDNALEAGATTLTLSAARVVRQGPEPALLHPPRPGAFLELTLADDGPGMDADELARCVEPMATSHRERAAEGLGLPVVYGLMALHHGGMRVASTPGEGTRCALLLPLREA